MVSQGHDRQWDRFGGDKRLLMAKLMYDPQQKVINLQGWVI